MQFAPQQQNKFHKRNRSVPKMDRQLKKGEQNIEEEEKKEYSDTERELTSFSIMERKYNPETDTKENYQTIENQYGYYTNKRFDSF